MIHPKQTLTPGQAARDEFRRQRANIPKFGDAFSTEEMRSNITEPWDAIAAAAIEAAKQSGVVQLSDYSNIDPDYFAPTMLKPTPPTENKDEREH